MVSLHTPRKYQDNEANKSQCDCKTVTQSRFQDRPSWSLIEMASEPSASQTLSLRLKNAKSCVLVVGRTIPDKTHVTIMVSHPNQQAEAKTRHGSWFWVHPAAEPQKRSMEETARKCRKIHYGWLCAVPLAPLLWTRSSLGKF